MLSEVPQVRKFLFMYYQGQKSRKEAKKVDAVQFLRTPTG